MATLKRSTAHRLYWPGCSVCQYMQKHKQFRYDVMQSKYFNMNAKESLSEVIYRYGSPFKITTVYNHMKRHQIKDIIKAEQRAEEMGETLRKKPKAVEILQVVESTVSSSQPYEQGLDDFIAEGRAKLATNEMAVNATSFLQAIKIKADIEKSTKDRRLDAVKSFFGSASQTPAGTQGPSQD